MMNTAAAGGGVCVCVCDSVRASRTYALSKIDSFTRDKQLCDKIYSKRANEYQEMPNGEANKRADTHTDTRWLVVEWQSNSLLAPLSLLSTSK